MTFYEKSIIQITGCSQNDVAKVEDYMRNIVLHGACLDGLSSSQFNKAAKTAYNDIMFTRSPEGLAWCKKNGIDPM